MRHIILSTKGACQIGELLVLVFSYLFLKFGTKRFQENSRCKRSGRSEVSDYTGGVINS
jgi:hypothetical protein